MARSRLAWLRNTSLTLAPSLGTSQADTLAAPSDENMLLRRLQIHGYLGV